MALRICSPFTYAVTSWSNFSLETHHIISELNIWAKLFSAHSQLWQQKRFHSVIWLIHVLTFLQRIYSNSTICNCLSMMSLGILGCLWVLLGENSSLHTRNIDASHYPLVGFSIMDADIYNYLSLFLCPLGNLEPHSWSSSRHSSGWYVMGISLAAVFINSLPSFSPYPDLFNCLIFFLTAYVNLVKIFYRKTWGVD